MGLCCLVVEIIMFVLGIIGVIHGRVALTRNRVASGRPARIAGGLLLIPLPIGIVANLIVGFVFFGQGKPNNDPAMGAAAIVACGVDATVTAICFVSAIIVCAVTAQPTSKLKAKAKAAAVEQLGHFHPRGAEETGPSEPDDRYEGRRAGERGEAPDDRIHE
jgi:hypothetical protein